MTEQGINQRFLKCISFGSRTNKLLACFFLSTQLLFAGCSETRDDKPSEYKVEFSKRVERFISDGHNVAAGNDGISKIIKKFGNPIDIKTKKVKNRHHPEVTDETYELFYEGLYLAIYKTGDGKELVARIAITGNKYKLGYGLKIGDSQEAVKNILGTPTKEPENKFTYDFTYDFEYGYTNTSEFLFKDNKLYKVEWKYWID